MNESEHLCLTLANEYLYWADSGVPIPPGVIVNGMYRCTVAGKSEDNDWVWFLNKDVHKQTLQPANAAQPT